jgi:MFS family permease
MLLSATAQVGRMASSQPRMARLAVDTAFFVNGAAQASWVARIPAVQERLGARPGALGLALWGLPIGLLLAMPVVGWLLARYGSRPVTRAAALAYCAALPLLALAPALGSSSWRSCSSAPAPGRSTWR